MRPYGISILTAAQLIGLPTFIFSRRGITKAALAADQAGLGIQLLPLRLIPGISEPFDEFLRNWRNKEGNRVISYEGCWDNSNKRYQLPPPDQGIGTHYLLFPTRYTITKERIRWMSNAFPNAVAINSDEHSAQKVTPDTNPHPAYWENLANKGVELVIDTNDLHEWWEKGCGWQTLISLRNNQHLSIPLLQVTFRTQDPLKMFLRNDGKNSDVTSATLRYLRPKISADTPVVIKLAHGLVPKQELLTALLQIRERIRNILDDA